MMIIKNLADIDSELESSIRDLLDLAYEGDFSSEDWEHTFGGQYFIGFLENTIIAHGAVVPRPMTINGTNLAVGYVEAIAVLPSRWRLGFGTQLMKEVTQFCHNNYEISMLSTDENQFYQRIGWLQFQGESFVKNSDTEVRTAEEDEGLMFLPGKKSGITQIQRAVCDARGGDSW
jgi:aminoglycoside 2'-N-acetyltransferase I